MLNQELLVGKHFLAFRTINSGVIHFYAQNMLGIMDESTQIFKSSSLLKRKLALNCLVTLIENKGKREICATITSSLLK